MTAASRVNAHGTMGLGRWSIYINNGFWKPRDFDVLIIELLQYAIQGRVSGILLFILMQYVVKVTWEVVMQPLTYKSIDWARKDG